MPKRSTRAARVAGLVSRLESELETMAQLKVTDQQTKAAMRDCKTRIDTIRLGIANELEPKKGKTDANA